MATLTPKPADPVSKPIPGQQPLPIANLIQRADTAVPNATTTYVSFPEKPEEPCGWAKSSGVAEVFSSLAIANFGNPKCSFKTASGGNSQQVLSGR